MQKLVIFSWLLSADADLWVPETVDTVRLWFLRFKVLSSKLYSLWKVVFTWLSWLSFFLSRRGVKIGLFDLLLVIAFSRSFWPFILLKYASTLISYSFAIITRLLSNSYCCLKPTLRLCEKSMNFILKSFRSSCWCVNVIKFLVWIRQPFLLFKVANAN